jgi:prepilin-type processing-associated H-X9-DG protein
MDNEKSELPQPLEYRSPGIESGKRVLSLRELLLAVVLVVMALIFIGSLFIQRASRVSTNVVCLSNLHQIGLYISQYAQDHGGQYPDFLATLLLANAGHLRPSVFVCPTSPDSPAVGATTQAIQTNLQSPGHVSYVYLGKGLNRRTVPPNAVIAIDAVCNHRGGVNVLYGDGHVQWADSLIAAKIFSKVAATSRPVTIP